MNEDISVFYEEVIELAMGDTKLNVVRLPDYVITGFPVGTHVKMVITLTRRPQ